jgi:hypothetical protein
VSSVDGEAKIALAFQIGAGHMNFGAGAFAAIDPVHEIQVRVGLDARRRAEAGNAPRPTQLSPYLRV